MEIGTREQDAGLVRRQGDQLHPPTGRFRDDRLVDGQSAVEAGPDHQPAARPGDGLQEAERRVPVAVAERPRRLLLAPVHAPPRSTTTSWSYRCPSISTRPNSMRRICIVLRRAFVAVSGRCRAVVPRWTAVGPMVVSRPPERE